MLEGEWLTISEAADAINVTERTVRRQISEGRIKSKLEDGRRLVFVDAEMLNSARSQESGVIEQLRRENEYLRQELGRRTSEIANLHQQLRSRDEHLSRKDEQAEQARQRQDTIILQLTRQLENSQQMLQYRRKSFWRRWFGKKED